MVIVIILVMAVAVVMILAVIVLLLYTINYPNIYRSWIYSLSRIDEKCVAQMPAVPVFNETTIVLFIV